MKIEISRLAYFIVEIPDKDTENFASLSDKEKMAAAFDIAANQDDWSHWEERQDYGDPELTGGWLDDDGDFIAVNAAQ